MAGRAPRDSGPTGARGADSFPGHKAVTQGHTAGPARVAAGGPPAHRALPSLEPPAGPLSQAHATGLPLPLGRGQDAEIKALAPGSHGINPAPAIPRPEPQFLHLYVRPCPLVGLSSPAHAEGASVKGPSLLRVPGCGVPLRSLTQKHGRPCSPPVAWPAGPGGAASGTPGVRKICQQSSEQAPRQSHLHEGQAAISLAVACARNSARHTVRVGFTGVHPGLSHRTSSEVPTLALMPCHPEVLHLNKGL